MSICQESSLLSIIRSSHSFMITLNLRFMYSAKIYKCPHPHPKKFKIILEENENYSRHWIDTNRTGLGKSLTNGHDQERGGGSLPFNKSFLIYFFDDFLWRRLVAFHSKNIFISFAYFQNGGESLFMCVDTIHCITCVRTYECFYILALATSAGPWPEAASSPPRVLLGTRGPHWTPALQVGHIQTTLIP